MVLTFIILLKMLRSIKELKQSDWILKRYFILTCGFKPKDVLCKKCNQRFATYEEKKTDVAMASKIIELASKSLCEVIGIVSGDTDLIPAIELARKINPAIKIIIIFPFRRTNDELKLYSDKTFTIKPIKYKDAQFKGIVKTNSGEIAKPSHW